LFIHLWRQLAHHPLSQTKDGRGPAWANSLFEDNAEFGLGFRLTLDKQAVYAHELLKKLETHLGSDLVTGLLNADQSHDTGIQEQRERVVALKKRLESLKADLPDPALKSLVANLQSLCDVLVRRCVWIVGGDGWAYDIGYGGLDHVLASGRNVKVLVLDTEVYSNTGGQASKATPRGAVAKFAAGGKSLPKKDLGLLAVSYGNIYVARVAMGANDAQTIKAFVEAEAYDGPSLIIAYSHCIAHGYDLRLGLDQQKKAVQTGYWPLFRYNPSALNGHNPFTLDSKEPSLSLDKYIYNEARYSMLTQINEGESERLLRLAQEDVQKRWKQYQELAANHS
jgi:pyruvate-ferredoxin/flavodoxin oxidoreductase